MFIVGEAYTREDIHDEVGGGMIKTVDACPFCYEKIKKRIVEELNSVVAIEDRFAVSDGHLLIVHKRHCADYFELTKQEREDADNLLKILKKQILQKYPSVTGFNIGMNCGVSAGQTIFHTHIHLIPRRDGDTPNPRGGVRGVIPDKMGY